jgi:hypothetical protein
MAMKLSDPSSTVYSAGPLDTDWTNDPLNYAVKCFIAFLQTIFEAAEPGYFHWRPALEETEIVITEENPVKVDTIERKPVISVILGPTQFNGSSLDDLLTVKASNAQEIHTDLLPGTMSLACMSKVPQEARFIGWLCARTIWNLRKIFIREALFHEVGRKITVGSVSPAGALVTGDTEGEWHAVSVSCPFYLQWTDSVTPLKHDWNGRPIYSLQQIILQFHTRMNQAQPNLTHAQAAGPMLWGEEASRTHASQLAERYSKIRPARIRGRVITEVAQPGSNSIPLEPKFKVK